MSDGILTKLGDWAGQTATALEGWAGGPTSSAAAAAAAVPKGAPAAVDAVEAGYDPPEYLRYDDAPGQVTPILPATDQPRGPRPPPRES